MNRALYIAILIVLFASCAQTGQVEVGFNDDPDYTLAVPGNMSIIVTEIEIGNGSEFTSIWDGSNRVVVPVTSQDFSSITNDYVEVTPGSYNRIRMTVDSVFYTTETDSALILGTSTQFTASSFSDIEVGTTEMRLVVDIASANWFDSGTPAIIPGHSVFEGATFRESY